MDTRGMAPEEGVTWVEQGHGEWVRVDKGDDIESLTQLVPPTFPAEEEKGRDFQEIHGVAEGSCQDVATRA